MEGWVVLSTTSVHNLLKVTTPATSETESLVRDLTTEPVCLYVCFSSLGYEKARMKGHSDARAVTAIVFGHLNPSFYLQSCLLSCLLTYCFCRCSLQGRQSALRLPTTISRNVRVTPSVTTCRLRRRQWLRSARYHHQHHHHHQHQFIFCSQ